MKMRGHKFCGGDTITIADFQLFFEFKNLTLLGRSIEAYPTLVAWQAACTEQAGIKEINAAWTEKVLAGVAPMVGKFQTF